MQALRLDDKVVVEEEHFIERTDIESSKSKIELYGKDTLATEITFASLQVGREVFKRKEFDAAETMLTECLASMRKVCAQSRWLFDLEEIQLQLTIPKAEGSHSSGKGERAITPTLGEGLYSDGYAELHFNALQSLVKIYFYTNTLEPARSSC